MKMIAKEFIKNAADVMTNSEGISVTTVFDGQKRSASKPWQEDKWVLSGPDFTAKDKSERAATEFLFGRAK